jgi:hypothetical protein
LDLRSALLPDALGASIFSLCPPHMGTHGPRNPDDLDVDGLSLLRESQFLERLCVVLMAASQAL